MSTLETPSTTTETPPELHVNTTFSEEVQKAVSLIDNNPLVTPDGASFEGLGIPYGKFMDGILGVKFDLAEGALSGRTAYAAPADEYNSFSIIRHATNKNWLRAEDRRRLSNKAVACLLDDNWPIHLDDSPFRALIAQEGKPSDAAFYETALLGLQRTGAIMRNVRKAYRFDKLSTRAIHPQRLGETALVVATDALGAKKYTFSAMLPYEQTTILAKASIDEWDGDGIELSTKLKDRETLEYDDIPVTNPQQTLEMMALLVRQLVDEKVNYNL